MEIEKKIQIANLFDIYGNLLTEKQQIIFKNYYFDDISLGEIAKTISVTRQAVYDSLLKSEKLLLNYEQKLKIFQIKTEQTKIVEKIKQTQNIKNIDKILDKWGEN